MGAVHIYTPTCTGIGARLHAVMSGNACAGGLHELPQRARIAAESYCDAAGALPARDDTISSLSQ
eukprot:4560409-Pleurochrysis_carterae.AAC.1